MRGVMFPDIVGDVDICVIEDVVAVDVDDHVVIHQLHPPQIAAPTATPAVNETMLLAINPGGDQ